MKVKISFVEEEAERARQLEAAVRDILERPRVKRVDTGEKFKQIYLTTKLPKMCENAIS